MYMLEHRAGKYLLCNLLNGLEGSGFGGWRGRTQSMRLAGRVPSPKVSVEELISLEHSVCVNLVLAEPSRGRS